MPTFAPNSSSLTRSLPPDRRLFAGVSLLNPLRPDVKFGVQALLASATLRSSISGFRRSIWILKFCSRARPTASLTERCLTALFCGIGVSSVISAIGRTFSRFWLGKIFAVGWASAGIGISNIKSVQPKIIFVEYVLM